MTEEVTLEIYRSFFVCFSTIKAFENAVDLRVCPNPNANLRVTRVFLFCTDRAICAKNRPKRTSHGVARAIVKGTSLQAPSPIMAPGFTHKLLNNFKASFSTLEELIYHGQLFSRRATFYVFQSTALKSIQLAFAIHKNYFQFYSKSALRKSGIFGIFYFGVCLLLLFYERIATVYFFLVHVSKQRQSRVRILYNCPIPLSWRPFYENLASNLIIMRLKNTETMKKTNKQINKQTSKQTNSSNQTE